jgi:hypothetical protein
MRRRYTEEQIIGILNESRAGAIRVGYAIGSPRTPRPLRSLQVGPINVASLVGARTGLGARAWLGEPRVKLNATRSRLKLRVTLGIDEEIDGFINVLRRTVP